MAYQPTTTLQAYWDCFPLRVHISKVRCPVHRQTWLFMDEISEEAWCYTCDRHWTTTEIVMAHQTRSVPRDTRPRLPEDIRQYYPNGVTCPECRLRLRLQISAGEGVCRRCEQIWTFTQLIDHAARTLMEERPNGATVYHKPRRG